MTNVADSNSDQKESLRKTFSPLEAQYERMWDKDKKQDASGPKATKMCDMARKGHGVPSMAERQEPDYPYISLSTAELPGLKGAVPGDTGVMKVEYKIRTLSLKDKDKGDYTIELRKIGLTDDDVEKELTPDERDMYEMRALARKRMKAGRTY